MNDEANFRNKTCYEDTTLQSSQLLLGELVKNFMIIGPMSLHFLNCNSSKIKSR